MAMSVDVAISSLSFVEMVTLPVAPETLIPEPATFESTPVLLNDVPSKLNPVPAVVVEVLYTFPFPSTANAPVSNDVMCRFVVVAFVVEAKEAKNELGKMTWLGRESVHVLFADKSCAPADEET